VWAAYVIGEGPTREAKLSEEDSLAGLHSASPIVAPRVVGLELHNFN
jgi:hypothetical protein